ncbi:hypothetical protein ATCV1_z531R [Acanthocystis turfacea chlorella virus 1]|uniref:Uncharacterized protein z531R n=1 Tax=Chlorovirus heliozoae TaxID=322019 RepID=A7K9E1_9PHYC|nr:hypothetical protein ATCV1_z531R [Acanthocystis turfacea chlorella virus 1]ABT16665.1 hypothetical protein ATCV1_z531R [Acanthocystis turfacea chlorella virus 1]
MWGMSISSLSRSISPILKFPCVVEMLKKSGVSSSYTNDVGPSTHDRTLTKFETLTPITVSFPREYTSNIPFANFTAVSETCPVSIATIFIPCSANVIFTSSDNSLRSASAFRMISTFSIATFTPPTASFSN